MPSICEEASYSPHSNLPRLVALLNLSLFSALSGLKIGVCASSVVVVFLYEILNNGGNGCRQMLERKGNSDIFTAPQVVRHNTVVLFYKTPLNAANKCVLL